MVISKERKVYKVLKEYRAHRDYKVCREYRAHRA